MEKKGFGVKKREIDHIESSYKSKKSQFQRYNTQSSSSQIANTNFNFSILARKLEPQNHQVKNQAESFPKKNYQRTQEQLPPLSLPLNEMYQKLLSIRQVAPVPLTPLQPSYPSWYKSDLTCEYHAGIAGYNIHTCNAFKRKLLQLIKAGWITFEDAPNMNTNPLPNHASGSGFVNMLEIKHSKILKVSMDRIYQMMVDARYKEGSEKCCEHHNIEDHVISHCEGFHKKVKQMMSRGLLQIEKATSEEVFMMKAPNKEVCRVEFTTGRPPKLVLSKPVVEHKGNYSALPHDYEYSFKNTRQLPIYQEEIRGLTHSDRCFTPEEPKKQRKAKGKEGFDVTEEINKPVMKEKTNEFLKLMKYSVVEQLKKTPARISLLSLILSSEPHRKALQKVLNEAYVPQDIN
jgi:hypothetical protein